MKNLFLPAIWLALPITIMAQENTEKLTISMGGYIRTETFYDSYRSAEARDGESYNYPLRRGTDVTGKDTNRVNQFEMLGIQSRFKVKAFGLSAMGAKVSGCFEADFLGSTEDAKYNVVFRHAFIKLEWEKTHLLMGQYWAPMSLPEFTANTVLFASGTTFLPVSRATQAKLTYFFSPKILWSGAIMAHSTHRVIEPKGINSQRYSGLPDFQMQFQYGTAKDFYFVLTAGYKFVRPYLSYSVNGSKYKATQNIGSYNLQAGMGYQFPKLTAKFQANLGENLTNYGMIGGYSPIKGSVNEKGEPDYANITTMSLWTDFETKGERVKFGLFVGYSGNLGTKDSVVINKTLTRDADIKQLLRISPRMYIINGPIDIGIEYIMNAAVYGKFENTEVVNTEKRTINNRVLVSVRYTF